MFIEVFIMGLKQLCKDFVPPLLWRLAQRMLVSHDDVPVSFSGNYPDWLSAQAASVGYDSDTIFSRVLEAARKVKDGDALWERDSVLFYHEEYNTPLLYALMSVAAWNKGKLRVLDFGGAFGSTYWQHRRLLQRLEALSWNVVEQSQCILRAKIISDRRVAVLARHAILRSHRASGHRVFFQRPAIRGKPL